MPKQSRARREIEWHGWVYEFNRGMERAEEALSAGKKVVEVKPSLLALVSEKEMRTALQKVQEMSIADRDKYSRDIMKAYAAPLLEFGFVENSFSYEVAQTILSAVNFAIFGRTY